ncbi:MAG: RDD family protein [Lysobacter sp.]
MATTVSLRPAGFWQRSVAWSLDAALIAPWAVLLAWRLVSPPAHALRAQTTAVLQAASQAMADAIINHIPVPQLATALLQNPALHEANLGLQSTLWSVAWPLVLTFSLLSGGYHVGCESSRRQATPGQRLLGLQVVDSQWRAVEPGRALARHLAGTLSWATLNIGHLMATIEPRHLALHDRIAATRVVTVADGTGENLPIWAQAWLGIVGIAALALTVWGATSAMAVMREALEQALL